MSLFFVLCVFVPFSTHLGELAVVPTCVLKKSAVFLDFFAVFPRVVFRVPLRRYENNMLNEVEILKMMGKGKHVGSITMCWKTKSEKVEKKGRQE